MRRNLRSATLKIIFRLKFNFWKGNHQFRSKKALRRVVLKLMDFEIHSEFNDIASNDVPECYNEGRSLIVNFQLDIE